MAMSRAARNRKLVVISRNGMEMKDELWVSDRGILLTKEQTNEVIDTNDRGELEDLVLEEDGEQIVIPSDVLLESALVSLSVAKRTEAKYVSLARQEPEKGLELEVRLRGFRNVLLSTKTGRGGGINVGRTIYESAVERARSDMILGIERGSKAREMLVSENEGLIGKVIESLCSEDTADKKEDLFGVAFIEFLNCVDRTYDPNRGKEFSTYVYSCMRAKCIAEMQLLLHQSLIRLPNARMILKR